MDIQKEREAFEAAMEPHFFSSCFEREDDGSYAARGLQGAWMGWQARAALSAEAVPVDGPFMWVRIENDQIEDYTQDAELAAMWMTDEYPQTLPLYAAPQPRPAAVPDGYALVPISLTRAVLNPITSEQYLNCKHKLCEYLDAAAPAPKTGFCGDPYVHDCGRSDCPTSDSYKKFVELASARQEVSDA